MHEAKLSSTIFRAAADLISSGDTAWDNHYVEFMCHAIPFAATGRFTVDAVQPHRVAFSRLLEEHGVPLDGGLGRNTGCSTDTESQAIRFDFLNLLAESFDAE